MFNVLLIPLILSLLLFLGALGFGMWAYMERDNYKTNTDAIADKAVAIAVERTKTEKDNEFLEKEKLPYRTFVGPSTLGSYSVTYPKTWSAHLTEDGNKATMIFHPQVVPVGDKFSYALRLEVLDQTYNRVAATYDSGAKTGKVKITPYALPKLPDVLGVRVDGEIASGKKGSAVILQLRDKTIKLTAESEEFVKDFDTIILPNFTYQP